MTAAVAILEQAKAAGVILWGEGGTLRYLGDKVQWKACCQCSMPTRPSCWRRLLNFLADHPLWPSLALCGIQAIRAEDFLDRLGDLDPEVFAPVAL